MNNKINLHLLRMEEDKFINAVFDNRFRVIKKLGGGSFGDVYLG